MISKKLLAVFFFTLVQSVYADNVQLSEGSKEAVLSCEDFANDFSCQVTIAGYSYQSGVNDNCFRDMELSCSDFSNVSDNFNIVSKQATFIKLPIKLDQSKGKCSYEISGTCVGPCGDLSEEQQALLGTECIQDKPKEDCTAETGVYYCDVNTNTVKCSAPAPVCPQEEVFLDPCDSNVVINSLRKSLEGSRWGFNDGVRSLANGKTTNYQAEDGETYQTVYSTWLDKEDDTEANTTFACVRNKQVKGNASATIDNVFFSELTSYYFIDNVNYYSVEHAFEGIIGDLIPQNTSSCYVCAAVRGNGCFDPQVQITLADGSAKDAGEIQVGDALFNPVTREAVSVSRVIEGPEKVSMVLFKYADGELKVSQEHPMLTANGLKQAKDVKAGEKLFNGDNSEIVVESAELLPVEEGQWVVNFILEGADMSKSENRMLLADGVITGDLQTQIELKMAK